MIAENLQIVKHKIDEACKRAGRDSSEIKLIAVTKTHPVEMIEEALSLGITAIGENKIQDACNKVPLLSKEVEFHFIGHLQSNKINKLMTIKPYLIHSLDSYSTAEKLNNYLERNGGIQNVLIQVNTTDEGQKSGVDPTDLPELLKQISQLTNLRIMGLMTIGMLSASAESNRKYFIQLRELSQTIKSLSIPGIEMKYLSMGMSDDYEIAIEEGANLIRVGSAIFGSRNYNKESK
jgi:pyridoxal phosphate enzyme (YggS family)